jgi:hypothetical protein
MTDPEQKPDEVLEDTDAAAVTRTLWILAKDGHTMTCTIAGEAGREQLKVLIDREVYLSETHTVPEGTMNRARLLHRAFEAHGWLEVPEAAHPAVDRTTRV